MHRLLALVPASLLLVSCAAAFAQDPVAAAAMASGAPAPGSDYLLALGPYGALLYGAYLVGRGVTIKVSLADEDRALIKRLVEHVEDNRRAA